MAEKLKPKPEPDDKEQSQRFVETAKAHEVDKSGISFDRALKIIRPSPLHQHPGKEDKKSAT